MDPDSDPIAPFLSEEYTNPDELDSDDSFIEGQQKNTPLREQDRFLPIANIAKIMKRAIPDNGKIAKDARECIQECVSEFISFVTSEASERCHQEKRKTINGEDILYALCTLGFDNYVEPLTIYLHKYRETTKSDRNITANDTSYESSSSEFSQSSTPRNGRIPVQVGDAIIYYQNTDNTKFTYLNN